MILGADGTQRHTQRHTVDFERLDVAPSAFLLFNYKRNKN